MKYCTKCKTEKNKTEFSKNKSNLDGLQYYCKSCMSCCNRTKEKRVCLVCNKEFFPFNYRSGKYCSVECRNSVSIPPSRIGCSSWNKGIPITKEQNEKLNSKEAKRKARDTYIKNHPNLITPESVRLRRNKKTDDWRNSVFKRDFYTCHDCGKRGGRLNAHHIKSWSKYPELRWDNNNGLTLCIECHQKRHPNIKCISKCINEK